MGTERYSDTKEMELPMTDNTPGTDRYLGTSQGWQGGGEQTRYTAEESGKQLGAQRQAVEAGG